MNVVVVFDTAYPNGTCPVTDSDIVGIGVVLSFTVAAFATLIAAIVSVYYDNLLHDSDGVYFSHIPNRFKRAIPTPKLSTVFNFRRTVCDKLIVSFADQQIITGIAILTSGYIKFYKNQDFGSGVSWANAPTVAATQAVDAAPALQSAQFVFIVYLCCLCSASHVSCLLVLRRHHDKYRTMAILRTVLISSFGVALIVSIIVSNAFGMFFMGLETAFSWVPLFYPIAGTGYNGLIIVVLSVAYLYWISIINVRQQWKVRVKRWIYDKVLQSIWQWSGMGFVWRKIRQSLSSHRSSFGARLQKSKKKTWFRKILKVLRVVLSTIVWGRPTYIFVLMALFCCTSTAFVLMQKFAKAPTSAVCSLNGDAGNAWGFGQTLAIFMLTLPLMTCIEVYVELRHDTAKSYSLRSNTPSVNDDADDYSFSQYLSPSHIQYMDLAAGITERVDSSDIGLVVLPSTGQAYTKYPAQVARAVDDSDINLGTPDNFSSQARMARGEYIRRVRPRVEICEQKRTAVDRNNPLKRFV